MTSVGIDRFVALNPKDSTVVLCEIGQSIKQKDEVSPVFL